MLRKCAHVITNQVNNMPPTEEGEDPVPFPPDIGHNLSIACIMWRSQLVHQLIKEKSEVLRDAPSLWTPLVEKLYAEAHRLPDEALAQFSLLGVAPIFKFQQFDKIQYDVKSAIKRGTIEPNILAQALIRWERVSEIWSFIADRFHRITSKKVAGRIGFAGIEDEEEASWDLIFKYISILLEFPKAFKSPSCLELYEEMGKFENCYLEFLVSENETFSQDWSEANWSQFHSLKARLNQTLAGDNGDVLDKTNFTSIEKLFSSSNFSTLDKRRGAKMMLIGWMESLKFYIKQPLDALDDSLEIEEGLNLVLKNHSKLLLSCLDQIVEFLEALLKYRFFKLGKEKHQTIVHQYQLLSETILSDLVAQNQLRSSDVEVPLQKLQRFLIRFGSVNVPDHAGALKAAYMEIIADSVDLTLNFDQNIPVVGLLVKLIVPLSRNDIPMIDQDFAAWASVTRQSAKNKEYCQALIADALESTFGEDVSEEFSDFELFRRVAASSRSSRNASAMNESAFDNETMISVRHDTTQASSR